MEVPAVVGYLRPLVLLPASAILGLSTSEIEMVLAHELAHVRRYDYLVNLAARTAIEALLFLPSRHVVGFERDPLRTRELLRRYRGRTLRHPSELRASAGEHRRTGARPRPRLCWPRRAVRL